MSSQKLEQKFYEKYLKYKKKYLQLKRIQFGGMYDRYIGSYFIHNHLYIFKELVSNISTQFAIKLYGGFAFKCYIEQTVKSPSFFDTNDMDIEIEIEYTELRELYNHLLKVLNKDKIPGLEPITEAEVRMNRDIYDIILGIRNTSSFAKISEYIIIETKIDTDPRKIIGDRIFVCIKYEGLLIKLIDFKIMSKTRKPEIMLETPEMMLTGFMLSLKQKKSQYDIHVISYETYWENPKATNNPAAQVLVERPGHAIFPSLLNIYKLLITYSIRICILLNRIYILLKNTNKLDEPEYSLDSILTPNKTSLLQKFAELSFVEPINTNKLEAGGNITNWDEWAECFKSLDTKYKASVLPEATESKSTPAAGGKEQQPTAAGAKLSYASVVPPVEKSGAAGGTPVAKIRVPTPSTPEAKPKAPVPTDTSTTPAAKSTSSAKPKVPAQVSKEKLKTLKTLITELDGLLKSSTDKKDMKYIKDKEEELAEIEKKTIIASNIDGLIEQVEGIITNVKERLVPPLPSPSSKSKSQPKESDEQVLKNFQIKNEKDTLISKIKGLYPKGTDFSKIKAINDLKLLKIISTKVDEFISWFDKIDKINKACTRPEGYFDAFKIKDDTQLREKFKKILLESDTIKIDLGLLEIDYVKLCEASSKLRDIIYISAIFEFIDIIEKNKDSGLARELRKYVDKQFETLYAPSIEDQSKIPDMSSLTNINALTELKKYIESRIYLDPKINFYLDNDLKFPPESYEKFIGSIINYINQNISKYPMFKLKAFIDIPIKISNFDIFDNIKRFVTLDGPLWVFKNKYIRGIYISSICPIFIYDSNLYDLSEAKTVTAMNMEEIRTKFTTLAAIPQTQKNKMRILEQIENLKKEQDTIEQISKNLFQIIKTEAEKDITQLSLQRALAATQDPKP
jgi:hypothetical protein